MTARRTEDGPVVLALEASTANASVAVVRGGRVLAERAATMRAGTGDALMPAVDAVLTAAGVGVGDLAAVVCGAGPGGFTSLRIAAALAKGLAHATGCALVAVPSLALAAAARAAPGAGGDAAWLVTMDALRGERYAAHVTTAGAGDGVAVTGYAYLGVVSANGLAAEHARAGAPTLVDANAEPPPAAAVRAFALRGFAGEWGNPLGAFALFPVDLDGWEPGYGRQAEAQARWERAHGRALATELAPAVAVSGTDDLRARDAGGR